MEGEAAELRRADLASDPLEQFRSWFAEAGAALEVPEAMALATATPGGAPSVRMVLLKGFDERGLVFFSHYTSRKGRELEANPQAALLFHWSPLGRQVRVEGRVEPVSDDGVGRVLRDAAARRAARCARLAAERTARIAGASWTSGSSELESDLGEGPVPRPPTWGGFRLVPTAWEFWQHRAEPPARPVPLRAGAVGRLASRAALPLVETL